VASSAGFDELIGDCESICKAGTGGGYVKRRDPRYVKQPLQFTGSSWEGIRLVDATRRKLLMTSKQNNTSVKL
jgi:hypothetical protein